MVLDLGTIALTGVFPPDSTVDVERTPVRVGICADCGLAQLLDSYSLESLYGENYGYRSGLNLTMVRHLERISNRLSQEVELTTGDTVLDIGANDGTLLASYKVSGLERIGIDPTIKKFSEFYAPEIRQVADFFSASQYSKVTINKARIVTSIAMFYDLEDPVGFAKDICSVLALDGVWYFEQSYMPWMLRSGAYDTICQEHLEYYSLTTIKEILRRSGLKIIDATTNAVNGGSISVTAARVDSPIQERTEIVNWLLNQEEKLGVNTAEGWENFSVNVARRQNELLELLTKLKEQGKLVVGLGASTKGNVLLQTTGITQELLPMVGDVNPSKFGCFLPGTGIPICSEEEALALNPDYLLILPWHFRETFMIKLERYLSNGGRIIFPLPDIEVVGY